MDNGPFIDYLAFKRLIFRSYVSLPEGRQVGNLERKYHRATTFGISRGFRNTVGIDMLVSHTM